MTLNVKREFLMLAHKYETRKHALKVGGWYASEKLDGLRAFWDGGVSRGLPCSEVPWANNARDAYDYTATGFWTRGGKPIFAPGWFLDQLPVGYCLDGELWTQRSDFQNVMSIVRSHNSSDTAWAKVQYRVFGLPAYSVVFQTSTINSQNFYKDLSWSVCLPFLRDRLRFLLGPRSTKYGWSKELLFGAKEAAMRSIDAYKGQVSWHHQWHLKSVNTGSDIVEHLCTIEEQGGEGLILRNPTSTWEPRRSWNMLKVKKLHDAEAVVVGYTTGKITDKDSRHLGRVGALIVKFKDVEFEIAGGLSDSDRTLTSEPNNPYMATAHEWACHNPDTRCPSWISCLQYPRGTVVTFKYRDLTTNGIPKEARLWRKHLS